MPLRFSDAATSILSASITTTATSIVLESVASFPQNMVAGDYFVCVIANVENTVRETVKVTAINYTTKTFTVERGYDSTTPIAWSIGSKVEIRGGSALFKEMVNLVDGPKIQTGRGVTNQDSGIDLGLYRTGSGTSYINLYSNSSGTYSTQLIKYSIENGSGLKLENKVGDFEIKTQFQSLKFNETTKRSTFSIHGFEFKTDNGVITPINKTRAIYPGLYDASNTWTVPNGVSHIFVKMWGAGGSGGAYGGWRQGSVGGGGGYTHGIIPVTPGDTVTIRPGSRAFSRWGSNKAFPDGGASSLSGGDNQYAGSGGGSSSIKVTSFANNAWCMFAGGGGGGGSVNGFALNSAGAGGGITGQSGVVTAYNTNIHNGKGGSQFAGGDGGTGSVTQANSGQFNQGGTHANANCYGGGGGGGYYGGGAGAYGNSNSMGGGGGGSGYVHPDIIIGVTMTGNINIPANFYDPDLSALGTFQFAAGGEEDGTGGPGLIVVYY